MSKKDSIYATIFERALAIFIDFFILSAHFFPITYFVKGTWLMSSQDHNWGGIFDPICAVFLIIIFAYFILFEGIFSASPGKAILGLGIRNIRNSKITMKQSLIRNAGRMVDGIFLHLVGIIIMIRNPQRQRLGDIWAKTYVVKIKKVLSLKSKRKLKHL